MRTYRVVLGLLILASIILIHLSIAFQFYRLDRIKLNDFFYWQAIKNELFNGQKKN